MPNDPYRVRFDAGPSPMWLRDRQTGVILDANEAEVHTYGYTGEGT